MTTTAAPQRHQTGMVVGGVLLLLVIVSWWTAPQPPEPGLSWRWATIAVGLALCAYNVSSAIAAVRRTGPVSVVAFLHLWVFFAFSFPAVEMTFRYEQIMLGYWSIWTDDPLLLQAALLLGAFQVVFFLALGTRVEPVCRHIVETSRSRLPDLQIGLVFLLLLLPLVAARALVLLELGVEGVATAMTTRTDYFSQLESEVGPIMWALNSIFPVYAVSLGCLAVKFLVPHPSPLGRRLFLGVLIGSVAGVALSGGRAEIVFVSVTVALFMYVAGYRTARQFLPVLVFGLFIAALLIAVGQARHGEGNVLSRAAENAYVGNDYSGGDITQILGLGRFEFMVMILDRHLGAEALLGSSYLWAIVGSLQTSFLLRIAAGVNLPTPSVSSDVLGPWVFGGPQASALPSAPGEAYLNFGVTGVLVTAVVLGLLTRVLITLSGRLHGPRELILVLTVWTMARLLSDESTLIASFVVRNWPIMVIAWAVYRTTSRPSRVPFSDWVVRR